MVLIYWIRCLLLRFELLWAVVIVGLLTCVRFVDLTYVLFV